MALQEGMGGDGLLCLAQDREALVKAMTNIWV